ncbi:calcium-translocating P-type ATPase, PMCA-type [Candidatus Woesearchaeota archaeon]|nr:calcium-translocating P-type ATPase, PMCA-type [Candidatus Woesearchaeota archaeon]
MTFYNKDIKDIYKLIQSSGQGLSTTEAKRRLEIHGYNELEEKKKISKIALFLSQFKDPLVLVLIGAAFISVIIGYIQYFKHGGDLVEHLVEAGVIGIILLVNAVLGFVQEYNAEKAIEALKKMASLKANVIRDGEQKIIDARELVPGDIIILTEGEKIPADSRLIEVISLQTQEAALTGESLPVKKETIAYRKELEIGDRKNMVFSGTVITSGKGKAIVVKTGMQTEIGRIATLLQESEKELTPLQRKLEQLGKFLGVLTLIICFIVFGTGLLRGANIVDMFIYAVGLAVAAIPEGLPAVVTISLSLGVKKMIKRNVLIRKLPSVETLGCTTVICSDKTGTLTHNEMTVKKIFVDDETLEVEGSGYNPQGSFSKHTEDLELLLQIGVLNNDAKLEESDEENKIIGDPTEGALLVSGAKAGLEKQILDNKHKRIDEIPFDSKRKMMTTVHHIEAKKYAYVKGAPDILLEKCSRYILHGNVKKLTSPLRKKILKINDDFASNALRVLGFAYKEIRDKKKDDWEKNLIFVGLQGMIDPPRNEVKEAIQKCKSAGIKVVMITGDFIGTAKAIGKELGIEGKAVAGADLDSIDLKQEVENIGIYARVNPEDKMLIVEALKNKGHVVAMTGDGVNDAPALKKADLGIAMGITGTDVAKEASDMILTDDNFTSIVNAVEEGRGIYDNIRKFVVYLLSSNIGEIFVVFSSLLLGLPLPVIVTQLLWINLVTDGLPATALSVDPSEQGIMRLKPRKKESQIVDTKVGIVMFLIGILMMLSTVGLFYYSLTSRGWKPGIDIILKGPNKSPAWLIDAYIYSSTIAFTTLMMLQMFNVLNAKSQRESLFRVGPFNNKFLLYAIISSIALQALVIYTPLNRLFNTVAIGVYEWVLIVLVSSSVLIFGELFKLVGLKQRE